MLLTQSRSVGHHWGGGVGVEAVRVGDLGGGGGHGQAHQPAQEQLQLINVICKRKKYFVYQAKIERNSVKNG